MKQHGILFFNFGKNVSFYGTRKNVFQIINFGCRILRGVFEFLRIYFILERTATVRHV